MSAMNYKGYSAAVSFEAEDSVFLGRISGIRDQVVFEGESVSELKAAFERAVDGYLATCAEYGCDPEKPHSGRLMFRVDPALHARATMAAEVAGVSLPRWAEGALTRAADADLTKSEIFSGQPECSICITRRTLRRRRSARKWFFIEFAPDLAFYKTVEKICTTIIGCSFVLLLCVIGLIPSFSVIQFDHNPMNCLMSSVSHHYLWIVGALVFSSISSAAISYASCMDGYKYLNRTDGYAKKYCGIKGLLYFAGVLTPLAVSFAFFAAGVYFLAGFMGHIGQPAIARMTAPMDGFVCHSGT